MKSKGNAITIYTFIFGLIAVVEIVMSYIVPSLLYAWKGGNANSGAAASVMTYGMIMMSFGFFLWGASIVLIAANLFCNRAGIKTSLGRTGMALNVICFLYHAYAVCMIVRLF